MPGFLDSLLFGQRPAAQDLGVVPLDEAARRDREARQRLLDVAGDRPDPANDMGFSDRQLAHRRVGGGGFPVGQVIEGTGDPRPGIPDAPPAVDPRPGAARPAASAPQAGSEAPPPNRLPASEPDPNDPDRRILSQLVDQARDTFENWADYSPPGVRRLRSDGTQWNPHDDFYKQAHNDWTRAIGNLAQYDYNNRVGEQGAVNDALRNDLARAQVDQLRVQSEVFNDPDKANVYLASRQVLPEEREAIVASIRARRAGQAGGGTTGVPASSAINPGNFLANLRTPRFEGLGRLFEPSVKGYDRQQSIDDIVSEARRFPGADDPSDPASAMVLEGLRRRFGGDLGVASGVPRLVTEGRTAGDVAGAALGGLGAHTFGRIFDSPAMADVRAMTIDPAGFRARRQRTSDYVSRLREMLGQ